jgi:hypothetical protein
LREGAPTVTNAEEPVDRLQELILTRLRELGDESGPMSAREAARRADGFLSLERFRLLARGKGGRHKGRITDKTAEGLSIALQVPLAWVYEAAGAPTPGTRWELPERFDRIPPSLRQTFEELMAGALAQYEAGFQAGSGGKPSPCPAEDDDSL